MTDRQTGDTLIGMMNSRGGVDSEYTDEVLGRVQSTSPLVIWINQDLQIDSAFIELTTEAKGLTVPVHLNVSGTTSDNKKVSGTASGSVQVFRPLEVGDKVRMLRTQKGQRFIVLGRS